MALAARCCIAFIVKPTTSFGDGYSALAHLQQPREQLRSSAHTALGGGGRGRPDRLIHKNIPAAPVQQFGFVVGWRRTYRAIEAAVWRRSKFDSVSYCWNLYRANSQQFRQLVTETEYNGELQRCAKFGPGCSPAAAADGVQEWTCSSPGCGRVCSTAGLHEPGLHGVDVDGLGWLGGKGDVSAASATAWLERRWTRPRRRAAGVSVWSRLATTGNHAVDVLSGGSSCLARSSTATADDATFRADAGGGCWRCFTSRCWVADWPPVAVHFVRLRPRSLDV